MGWKLFPIIANAKTPALPGDWRAHATDDEAQIQAWEAAGYNLAVHLEEAGISVIDIDGPDGEAAWATISAGQSLPPTYEVKSPRGRHIYFRGRLRPSVGKLAAKVDTRGLGSYVLIPGSSTDHGVYEVLNDAPIAACPAWIPAAIERASPQSHEKAAVRELDLPVNMGRAVAYLERHAPLVMGAGADAALYEVACELHDYGVSPDRAIDLITDHLTIRPWEPGRTDAWIVRKVENAEAYAQNEPGAWGVAPLQQTFAAVLDQLPQKLKGGDEPDPFKALTEGEQDALRPPSWTMADLIPDNSVVLMYGPPGSYKSFLALDIGLTLAAGVPGWELPEAEREEVIYVAGEGPRSIARLRRPAWRAVRGVEGEIPFYLVATMPHASDIDQIDAFIASVKAQGRRPKLVIIDTWARFMLGLNENDAKEAGAGIAALERIKRGLQCSVMVLHHSSKEGKGIRGSSAIEGGVDTVHEVIPHKSTRVVAVHNRRQKDADERATPWLFEGKQFGQSLIFQPISGAEYRSLTEAQDELDQRKIGAVLLKLEARGIEKAITTHALAVSLYVASAEESMEVTATAHDRLARQLRAAGKGRLSSYCEKVGSDLKWYMPG